MPVQKKSGNRIITETLETGGSASISEPKTFEGTRFILRNHDCTKVMQVTYEKEVLKGLISVIQDISVEHGFHPANPIDLLLSLLGVGDHVVSIPGPSFENRKTYPQTYDFVQDFLRRDRNFVRSLLGAVFCDSAFSPDGVEAISLEERVASVAFDHSVGKRKIELFYKTGLHNDDLIGVTIEGYGNEPNSFRFRHTEYWVSKRLLAPYEGSPPARITDAQTLAARVDGR
jgi:hypothetical protein